MNMYQVQQKKQLITYKTNKTTETKTLLIK
jgi:hypothetical protein